MTAAGDVIITFHTTHESLVSERRLAEALPPVRLIPTPRSISSECGFTLLCPNREAAEIANALRDNALQWEAIYGVSKDSDRSEYVKYENRPGARRRSMP